MLALAPVIIDLTGPRPVYVIPDDEEPPRKAQSAAPLLPDAHARVQQAVLPALEAAQSLCGLSPDASTNAYSPLRPSPITPKRPAALPAASSVAPQKKPKAVKDTRQSKALLRPISLTPAYTPVTPRKSSLAAKKNMQRQLRQSDEDLRSYRRELRDKDYRADEASDDSSSHSSKESSSESNSESSSHSTCNQRYRRF